MSDKKPRKQVCWMPWMVEEKYFNSWIFGSKKDCLEWIELQDRTTCEPDEMIPVKVEIKEVTK